MQTYLFRIIFIALEPAKPLNDAQMCGSFYFYTLMTKTIPFVKGYSDPHTLVSLLQSRELAIPDESKAEHYLKHIGYYRLSAYMFPFLCLPKEEHKYKANASFEARMMLYRFDKKNALSAIAAYCFFENKPAIDVDFVNDGQLSLF